jgi:membrane dipeptidase
MLDPMSLSMAHEERARRIHQEAVIVLAHDHLFPPDDLADLRQGGVTAKILLAVIDTRPWTEDPEDYTRSIAEIDGWFEYACGIYHRILAEIGRSPELTLIRNPRDVLRAKAEGKTGILLGSEGGKLIEYDIDNLQRLYDLGLRHILLSWAYDNQLTAAETHQGVDGGLTPLGREVVAKMNELGMIIDITHISRQAMRDVLETSTRPVLNSHTALKSISRRTPALTEGEIRALADQGGVIALHFMTHMLTGRFSPPADLEEVLAQVDGIVNVGGVDCLALGPDYLPYTEEHKRNTKQPNLSFPVGLESPAKMLNLTRALVSHGYSDDSIHKILGGNLMRLLRETIN